MGPCHASHRDPPGRTESIYRGPGVNQYALPWRLQAAELHDTQAGQYNINCSPTVSPEHRGEPTDATPLRRGGGMATPGNDATYRALYRPEAWYPKVPQDTFCFFPA